MRWVFRVPMIAIAGALLGLILLLATLQYRWLGQISGAERDRMTANLNTRASAFALDVDRELTRAYLLFQLDPMPQTDGAVAGVVNRYDRWQATARFPRMIKDVYLAGAGEGQSAGSLQRFNPATRFLEPTEWPAPLSEMRTTLFPPPPAIPSPVPRQNGNTFVLRAAVPAVWPSVPAVVVQAPLLMLSHIGGRADAALPPIRMSGGVRYTVLVLDADYIKSEMLPALAHQHFQGTGDDIAYQLAVVRTASSGLVYHSVADFSPAADARVDATIDFFQVRPKDFEPLVHEVTRFATFTAMPRLEGEERRALIRQTVAVPPAGVAVGTAPMSVIVQRGPASADASGIQHRVDTLIAASGAALTGSAVNPSALNGAARATMPGPQWRLLVKHPSGSLEHAVNSVRRRNLIVSTGILGILSISVGFLVLSTRRAQSLARQQLEFVATVSHELRTPLAVIRSAADNLADGVVNDDKRIRQYGELVRREGVRLTDLVEQILEFAGLQSGQRTMASGAVSVGTMLREVSLAAASLAQPAGVTIDLHVADDLPPVSGDEAALRRVFQNLIANAMKYGAGGRWVGVRAVAKAGRLQVSVTDRGMGIAAGEQARVFDPFYRAPDVVAAQIQGAGLGLSLVKRIVEAHGGEVTLESVPGKGSTFTVFLPALKGAVTAGEDGVGQAAAQAT